MGMTLTYPRCIRRWLGMPDDNKYACTQPPGHWDLCDGHLEAIEARERAEDEEHARRNRECVEMLSQGLSEAERAEMERGT